MNDDKEKKVKKTASVRRPKFADEKYLGPEPSVSVESTDSEMGNAYTWFNYFYSADDAIKFTTSYLKSIKHDNETIKKIARIKPHSFEAWIGWNCRLLAQGSTLPGGVWQHTLDRIGQVTEGMGEDTGETVANTVNVISIQDRVNRKASDLIGELEEQLDVFFKAGVIQFDVKKWSLEKDIKPAIAKRIAAHFRPQFQEITEALTGKDEELVEAYAHWKKPILKIMAVFLKRIVDHMTELDAAQVAVRKPRKKKVKPVSQQVAKMKYLDESKELNVKSINPCDIVGASQLWVFNVKTRKLSVYNAAGNSGLAVKGTSIIGYDETSSVTKTLRKPLEVLHRVLNEGKVGLRKVMTVIKTKETIANGRINTETVLVRVVK
jgi:hypothetical protein